MTLNIHIYLFQNDLFILPSKNIRDQATYENYRPPHLNAHQCHDWQADLTATIGLNKNGFNTEIEIGQTLIHMNEFYYDVSRSAADWSIGRKPQQWSYAYNQSGLNWIDSDLLVMREQYFSSGSWQSWCYVESERNGCASRLSGWLAQFDWQLMLDYQNKFWRSGLGLQSQFGQGGLLYSELYTSEQSPYTQYIEPDIGPAVVTPAIGSQTKINLGAQWTTTFGLTAQAEFSWQQSGLNQQDWENILAQLATEDAYLISAAFTEPLARQQGMFRLALPWQNVDFETSSPHNIGNWSDSFLLALKAC